MTQPIRWDNMARSAGNPVDLMRLSQTGMNTAFDNLTGVLKQRTEMDEQNFKQGTVNNTRDFYAAINAPQTSEDFGAQRAALQAQMKGYGAQIAPEAMAALDGRVGLLNQRGTAQMEYDKAVAAKAAAPVLEKYYLGSPEERLAIRTANPGMAGLGELDMKITQQNLANEASLSTTTHNNALTAAMPEDQRIKGQAANMATLDRLAAMRERARDDLKKMGSGLMSGTDAGKDLVANINSAIPDKGRAEATNRQISAALSSNPQFKNLSLTQVTEIAKKYSKNTNDYTFSNFIPEMTRDLSALLGNGGAAEAAIVAAKADAASGLSQINQQIDAAQNRAFPELAADKVANDTKVAAIRAALPKVGVAAPAGTATSAPAAQAQQTAATEALFQQQVAVEVKAVQQGALPGYSPEVAAFLDKQPERDKAKFLESIKAVNSAASQADALNKDILTSPWRLLKRLSNDSAGGVGLPRPFQDDGGLDSLRPYSDRLTASRNPELSAADAKAKVELLKQQMAEIRDPSKKAK